MTNSNDHLPRIALVGCGAIARSFYAPALQRAYAGASGLIFVDLDEGRARALASEFGPAEVSSSIDDVSAQVDAAIVALPHAAHHPVASRFLDAGVNVLCEKPLTVTHGEAEELVTLADKRGVALAVNNTRRLFPSMRRVKELVASGTLGRLVRVSFHEGSEFHWPATTRFYFDPGATRRGVLFDAGAHGIDLVCWWLGGRPSVERSLNDSFGGPEATAVVDMRYEGVACDARFSWLTKLRNTFIVEGERGSVSGDVYDWRNIRLTRDGKTKDERLPTEVRSYAALGNLVVDNLIDIVTKGARPLIEGRDVVASLGVLDDCYAQAERLEMPWYQEWMVKP